MRLSHRDLADISFVGSRGPEADPESQQGTNKENI